MRNVELFTGVRLLQIVPVARRARAVERLVVEDLLHRVGKHTEPCTLLMQRHDDGVLVAA